MPELPDIIIYTEALRRRILERPLIGYALFSPFILRTVDPALDVMVGKQARAVERLGKRIVISFDGELHLVLHLMVAGRLRWRAADGQSPRRAVRGALLELEFASGTLVLTEAGTKRRASLHLLLGRDALQKMDRGGLEVMDASPAEFAARLAQENHTLKRALTDPRLFSGIGNAYSDEILHRARLSPLKLTRALQPDEALRLYEATQRTLADWTERLRAATGDEFPEKVTAFRDGMAVHGRFRQPCPVCGAPVQRIRYAENETNYCARCQTEGRLLADRALSRLLREDWPKRLDE